MSFQFLENHKDYLNNEYKLRRLRRPQYSLRAFARDLQVSPSTLTGYLKNNLKLSEHRIKELSDKIGLSKTQCEHWLDLFELEHTKSKLGKKNVMQRIKTRLNSEKNILSAEEFKLISEWHFLAILELIQIDPQKYSDLKTLSIVLNLKQSEVSESVNLLITHKLIELDQDKNFKVLDNTFVYSKSNSASIRHFHHQVLNKAQEALDTQSISERFNSSTYIAIPDDKVQVVINELNKTAVKLLEPFVTHQVVPDKTKLYCLSFQFFNLLNSSK